MSKTTNDFSNITSERRSIRVFDTDVTISKEEMTQILNKAAKAPSAVNMQPWRVVVVETPAGKEKLKDVMRFNARQTETSSAMILIFGDLLCYEKAEEIYGQAVNEGKMPADVRDAQLAKIVPYYKSLTEQQMREVVKIDASLFAMQFTLVAREHGYDTNLITGFDAENIAENVGLDPKRYVPVVVTPIGKAAETGFPSVRLSADKFTTFE